LLEAADGGTLFLDEVGNLPLNVQKTLLRFCRSRNSAVWGKTTPTQGQRPPGFGNNSDLTAEVTKGTFREDLFYRLNVINLHLPPLRERRDDIPCWWRTSSAAEHQVCTNCKGLTPEALEAAGAYPWPGNIRQLRNGHRGGHDHRERLLQSAAVLSQFIVTNCPAISTQADYDAALARFETEYLTRLLRKHAGNVEAAAAEAA